MQGPRSVSRFSPTSLSRSSFFFNFDKAQKAVRLAAEVAAFAVALFSLYHYNHSTIAFLGVTYINRKTSNDTPVILALETAWAVACVGFVVSYASIPAAAYFFLGAHMINNVVSGKLYLDRAVALVRS